MKKILVIDDQTEVIDIIEDFLYRKYEIYAAKNTARAISMLHTNNFDLILLDILLLGMNGIEFLQYMREQSWYNNPPVIFMSSESSFNIVNKAAHLSPSGYIKKPIEKKLLIEKIKTVIGE
ncbi:MAG: response regulator [Treponema sp.]|jgi:DNA-binding response OmpR family regulator|nr:response regulator [Treponema sp.]